MLLRFLFQVTLEKPHNSRRQRDGEEEFDIPMFDVGRVMRISKEDKRMDILYIYPFSYFVLYFNE